MREPRKAQTLLVMVRHGETEGESSVRYHGRSDVPLSALGRAQMKAVRDALGGLRFDRAFASPLQRARAGAEIIADGPPIIIKEFSEIDFGLFETLTAEEIRERYPEHFARWESERFRPDYAYPEGESRAAFERRVSAGLARMLHYISSDHSAPCKNILLVAHRGVLRVIARALVGAEPEVHLASVHRLLCTGQVSLAASWQIVSLDETVRPVGEAR